MRQPRPTIYAGGESEAAKSLIARTCDAYVMHGDPAGAHRAQDRRHAARAARSAAGCRRLRFGVAAYAIVRDPRSARRSASWSASRTSRPARRATRNYQDWIANTKLEQQVSLEDYSVSNRGLRAGLVGTPEQVADRVRALDAVGVDLLLLQCSPQLEEMERFAAEVMPLVGGRREAAA